MTADEKRRDIAIYRLEQAEETLDEAEYLLKGGKSPRVIINRAYYAMFYAVLALFVYEQYSSSKHSGILSYFNQKFVKQGRLSKEFGQSINIAFELRQRGDYREYSNLTVGQAEPLVNQAEEFVRGITDFMKINKLI